MSTTDVLIEMLSNAKSIPARFVLFDSWFTLPQTVISVKRENRDVIGMVRISEKIHYFYDGKRWDIEVFFKVCKSNLALAREFQGISYDTLTAVTAIVFMRYAMLYI